ncbi:MAG: methionine synthase [Bacteroidales bacterium]
MLQPPRLFRFRLTISLSRGIIEKMMQFPEGQSPDPFPELIDEVLAEVTPQLELCGGYTLVPVEGINSQYRQIQAGGRVFSVEKIVFHQLKKAAELALFQCTAGKKISDYSHKNMEAGELMKGYIADVIGSVAVEEAMDHIQASLKNEMNSSGLNISNRYSPGYCGWSVAEQQILFSFFSPGYFGIRLSDSSLMDPIKSVSGIIGIGEQMKENDYTCKVCDMKDCIYKDRK